MTNNLTQLFDDLTRQYILYNQAEFTESIDIAADIRDLYKNANLADVWDYLDKLNENEYDEETNLIYETRYIIADYVARELKAT